MRSKSDWVGSRMFKDSNQPGLRTAPAPASVGGVVLCEARGALSRRGRRILEGNWDEWEGERVCFLTNSASASRVVSGPVPSRVRRCLAAHTVVAGRCLRKPRLDGRGLQHPGTPSAGAS